MHDELDPLAETLPTPRIPADALSIDEEDGETHAPRACARGTELIHDGERPELFSAQNVELKGTLSQGGMGVIRSAHQRPLNREVVVKMVRRDADEGTRRRILDEGLIIARLDHPNIVPIHELCTDEAGDPVLVMKKIDGVAWSEILEDPSRAPVDAGNVDLLWHLDVLRRVCDALRLAHARDVVHCDVKPDNVMIGSFGEVYLVDWGVAVYIGDEDNTLPRPGDRPAVGTPNYAAPELLAGDDFDVRTDVYLLGATLHHILTGEARHVGKNLGDILRSVKTSQKRDYKEVPEELGTIANRATSRDKGDRYQRVDALWIAIQSLLEHRTSIELTHRARSLRESLVRSIHAGRGHAVINDRFVESRFGFREALRQWPENHDARVGHDKLLTTMFHYHVEQGHEDAASALIASFAEPPEHFAEKLHQLQLAKYRARKAKEAHEELRRQSDLTIGRPARFAFVIGLGLIWTLLNISAGWARLGVDPSTIQVFNTWAMARVGGPALLLLLWHRRLLRANAANRRIIFGLLGLLFIIGFGRLVAHVGGIPLQHAQVYEYFLYGLGAVSVGLISDTRIALLGPPLLVGALFAALFPQVQMFILAGLACASCSYLAWIWRPKRNAKERDTAKYKVLRPVNSPCRAPTAS